MAIRRLLSEAGHAKVPKKHARQGETNTDVWEKAWLASCHLAGRINRHGYVKMRKAPVRKIMANRMKSLFPHLSLAECRQVCHHLYGLYPGVN